MGVELVLSLRLPPFYGASVLLAANSARRRRTVTSAETHSNSEGNSDWKFHGAVDNHLHSYHNLQNHHHNQHQQSLHHLHPYHHHHHHPWQGSLDAGRHPGRLGSGFFIASKSDDVGEVEKQECAISLFHNDTCSSFVTKGDHITINSTCAEGSVEGIELPLSLRMLKRKQQDSALVSGFCAVGNSLLNAFSSVVSMMKALQNHTLQIRRQFFEQEIEGLLNQVQREMHVSFIWLFQQVFSCTPELMVLVMVLLTDFTAFSMVNNVPVLPTSTYASSVSLVSLLSNNKQVEKGLETYFNMSLESSPSIVDKADGFYYSNGGWAGNGGRGTYHIAGGADEDPDSSKRMVNFNRAPYSLDDQFPTELPSTVSMTSHDVSGRQFGLPPNDYSFSADDSAESDFSAMAAALALEELALADETSNNEPVGPVGNNEATHTMAAMEEIARSSSHIVFDQLTARSLVAPFTATIEDDKYSCYDRTDLSYQDAISNDSNNSLLLANYAQFLFLVRKDHDRAEELFRKAVVCDPFDSDAISGFASFLWLARHNLGAAEKAYQAALRAEPANSFHAANYAHFLWNSGL